MLKLLLLKIILLYKKFLNLLNILPCEKKSLKEKSFYFTKKNKKMRFIF